MSREFKQLFILIANVKGTAIPIAFGYLPDKKVCVLIQISIQTLVMAVNFSIFSGNELLFVPLPSYRGPG